MRKKIIPTLTLGLLLISLFPSSTIAQFGVIPPSKPEPLYTEQHGFQLWFAWKTYPNGAPINNTLLCVWDVLTSDPPWCAMIPAASLEYLGSDVVLYKKSGLQLCHSYVFAVISFNPGGQSPMSDQSEPHMLTMVPIADAGQDQVALRGETVMFDGSGSIAKYGTIKSYEWDFGDGFTDYGEMVEHVYGSLGIFQVTLLLTDDCNATDTDTVTVTVQAIGTTIDIKPGSDPNSINLCSDGAVSIAILGSDTFLVSDINTETLRFAEAAVKVVGRKDPHTLCSLEDVNGDMFDDLVCHYLTTDIAAIDGESTTATLNGELLDGTPFEGTDSVNIVKDTCQ